jgi:two-component system response regulator HydG
MGLARIASRTLENARELGWLRADATLMREDLQLTHDMIGESKPLRKAQETLAKVAGAVTTVLIIGESGTGKELAARAVHFNSPRRERAFVKVDCTGLNENLLASDLFGHERGAFTGAIHQKKGKFEVAHGGTVFLDEVGELPLSVQAQLLRVLQDREIERVGGTRPIRVDVRVVAATNRDLAEQVQKERFREDLFYRLNVVAVTLPPLRNRGKDKALLARNFASEFSRKVKRRVIGFADDAMAAIERYDWPGNVRELANAVERAVVLGSTERILREDLPELLSEVPLGAVSGAGRVGTFHEAVAEHKKQIIREALERAGGTITEAAKALGLHPNYLHRLIRNLGLRED